MNGRFALPALPALLAAFLAGLISFSAAVSSAAPRDRKDKDAAASAWLGEDMPLPLSVKTPADLAFKAAAERQYLIFNLLARGKLAWDASDFATAADKWERLLRVPGLDPDLDKVVRPLAADARARAGGAAGAAPLSAPAAPAPAPGPAPATTAAEPARPAPPAAVTVTGTVSGGGSLGPGGTVIWLRRADGDTPHPAPGRNKIIAQKGKTFVPRVLAVPIGTRVDFKNEDEIFHNVFSLSKPNEFDAGLYKAPQSYAQTFKKPGPVQLLCNIHSSMLGYVYVVDSPWYAQADGGGAFTIRGVPPGEYDIEAWHESSSQIAKERIVVPAGGAHGIAVKVSGDKTPPTFVPDKYGKSRQVHLGY